MLRAFQQFGLVVMGVIVLGVIGFRVWQDKSVQETPVPTPTAVATPAVVEIPIPTPSPTIITTSTPTTVPTKTPTPRPSPIAVATPTATPIPSTTVTPTPIPSAASVVVARMNLRRAEAGVAPLQTNAILMDLAQAQATDMVRRGYFNHTDPDGVTFQQRMTSSEYPASAVAEDLGLTTGDDAAFVVGLWMQSPGHRENMLGAVYVSTGIGIAIGDWQGQEALFVVAIFGAAR